MLCYCIVDEKPEFKEDKKGFKVVTDWKTDKIVGANIMSGGNEFAAVKELAARFSKTKGYVILVNVSLRLISGLCSWDSQDSFSIMEFLPLKGTLLYCQPLTDVLEGQVALLALEHLHLGELCLGKFPMYAGIVCVLFGGLFGIAGMTGDKGILCRLFLLIISGMFMLVLYRIPKIVRYERAKILTIVKYSFHNKEIEQSETESEVSEAKPEVSEAEAEPKHSVYTEEFWTE